MKEVIRLDNIRRDFVVGDEVVHALRGISLTITEGEFVTIMGTSGSGKSTLLNTLGCLDTPTSGEYYLDGIAVRSMDKNARATLRNRKIGFVFQNYNLLAKTTALENVELPLMYNSTYSAAQRRERAEQALRNVGLGDRMLHKSNQMSGGQMQRVAIARALVNDPAVILADEATGNLDTRTSFEVLVLFQQLHAQGRTIIFVTHNPEIARYSSRNVTLRDGHIISDVRNEEILSAAEALATLPATDDENKPSIRTRARKHEQTMNLTNLFKIAFKALSNNKLRGFLTMLGIIIGVGSVITMLAIGQGSKRSIQAQISEMGSNMIMIHPGGDRRGGVRLDAADMESLKLKDLEDIQAQARYISYISPSVNSSGQAIFGANNTPTTVYGISPEYLDIRRYKVEDGDIFSEQDVKTAAKVCLVGKSVVDELFPDGESPVGKVIRFGKIPLRIVGVLESKGYNSMGMDQDDLILAPYTTVQKRILAITHLQSITCSALSEEYTDQAIEEITQILRTNHKLKATDEDDFTIRSQQELSSMLTSTTDMMTLLLAAVAGISLLVGGIGIMNIMYVSVTERTREIGLRMSIGAKGRDILAQFLIESILISVTGGVIGILVGVGAAVLVNIFAAFPIYIQPWSVFLSFAVCTLTGIFFGWYPAQKAAMLNPIDALRYE